MRYIDVVFDGPPSVPAPRFVEAEDPDGNSIRAGEWINRGDGYWALRIYSIPEDEVRSSTPADEQRLVGHMRTAALAQLIKGRRPGRAHWEECDRQWLESRLLDKINQALSEGMSWKLAADISNYAAMLADIRPT